MLLVVGVLMGGGCRWVLFVVCVVVRCLLVGAGGVGGCVVVMFQIFFWYVSRRYFGMIRGCVSYHFGEFLDKSWPTKSHKMTVILIFTRSGWRGGRAAR